MEQTPSLEEDSNQGDDRVARDRYTVQQFQSESEFLQFVDQEKQRIDCLILQNSPTLVQLCYKLRERTILLPAIVLSSELGTEVENLEIAQKSETQGDEGGKSTTETANSIQLPSLNGPYHAAVVQLSITQLDQLTISIGKAISSFVKLAPSDSPPAHASTVDLVNQLTTQNALLLQQRRLADKLKARLGYLGLYYKRDPKYFLRHLSADERRNFLEQLKSAYREIILNYFLEETALNQKIDSLVDMSFIADISVSQIVEIHMELMDEIAKQLKLEGRSEEILLDYRLTLIDVIAHLCEMYRRSIPRGA
ncbi:MAG: circadian clock protein KaiA [Leptolyngbyaceae bacterium]|nr:circadian clock protein KaiA [Leptolyngbyaceae bacterium]